jgi:DNA-binding NtrC family response regulator
MGDPADKRQGPDRRRRPRGGRRTFDAQGFTPLVMVIDSDASRRDISEAILAKLRFAVAPVDSVDKAAAIIRALRPEIIVTSEEDAGKIREAVWPDQSIPIVAVGADSRVTDALVDRIRRALGESLP